MPANTSDPLMYWERNALIMHYFLVIISLILSGATVFANSRVISWDDLFPGEAVRFDDAFEKTDPASKIKGDFSVSALKNCTKG